MSIQEKLARVCSEIDALEVAALSKIAGEKACNLTWFCGMAPIRGSGASSNTVPEILGFQRNNLFRQINEPSNWPSVPKDALQWQAHSSLGS